MNNRRRKLNIKRVIIAIAILITILLIVGLVFPKLLAALIILFFIISTIIVMIREWKGILLFSVLILSYTLLDNSVINTVVLGFFFNIVYISLSFSPKWNRRKIRIQRYIEDGLKDRLSFNVPFFEQVRDREKAIITMFFYSISILPSVTLKILQDKKDFIFDHVPLSHDAYSLLLHLFKVNEFSPIVLKRICVSFFLILAYLITITIIIMVTKESRLILKEIRKKYDRDKTYWNNEKIELDDDDLIFLDVVDKSKTNN